MRGFSYRRSIYLWVNVKNVGSDGNVNGNGYVQPHCASHQTVIAKWKRCLEDMLTHRIAQSVSILGSLLDCIIEELAGDYSGKIKVGKVDTDANKDVSVKFGISAIPTVILFQGGEIKEKFVGLRGKNDFVSAIEKVIG